MALLQKTCSSSCFVRATKAPRVSRASVVVRASNETTRRELLSGVISTATLLAAAPAFTRRELLSGVISTATLIAAAPAFAAYGDSANVFGKRTNTSGIIPYVGDGFTVQLPARWNPSREVEFKGTVLRYVDNGAAANNLTVISQDTSKGKIEDYGSTDDFLKSVGYLLGEQSYDGETRSEGGFAPGRVSAASLLEVKTEADRKGRTSYYYQILVRTADGDEGGKHQVIKATVADGKLWIIKCQVGDKRWFKGADKGALAAIASFTVA
eukprot:gene14551-20592_t